ncbi:winged helix-turn-helix transcriptional regulator [Ideonella sp. BN130291]|uniref:winged helix-turn-helix transcriptional regulator n=1 Tax=Ideonella sp. BN130291 TaxID=3112940 RepID=UPI002E273633|nr:helix-turn-helix domain-containing protein [Ideonella sp. BN130291]
MSKPVFDVYDAACPSRRALTLVANKWSLLLPALRERPMRNGELLRRIGGISQKVLTQTLRELQHHGLVERQPLDTVPPQVEYRLTPMARSLSDALLAVDRWVEERTHALGDQQGPGR